MASYQLETTVYKGNSAGSNSYSNLTSVYKIDTQDTTVRYKLKVSALTDIAATDIKSITLTMNDRMPTATTDGTYNLHIGFTSTLSSYPTDWQTGTVAYVKNTNNPVSFTLNATPTVDVSKEWYIHYKVDSNTQYFNSDATSVFITVHTTGGGGGSGSKTLQYHDGTGWVECETYYHNGTQWVLCEPYFYNGSSWN